jgi:potassium channel subfamily K
VTRRQRSLLIIVMILLVYIAFGALVNSLLIDLDFINGLYFTVVSIETVGFGDIVPDNTGSRVFMCFYIVFGILNLGVAVGMARETIFEQLQNSYQKRLAKIRHNYQEHRRWKSWERKWKRAVEWRLREIPAEVWVSDFEGDSDSAVGSAEEESNSKWTLKLLIGRIFHIRFRDRELHKCFQAKGEIRGVTHGHPGTHLGVEALSPAQLEAAAVESGLPMCVLRVLRGRLARASDTETISSGSSASTKRRWRRWFWSKSERPPTERPTTPFMKGLEDMSGLLTKFAIATTGVGMNRMPAWGAQEIHRQQLFPRVDSVVSDTTTLSDGSRSASIDDLREITNKEERIAFWAKVSSGYLSVRESGFSVDVSWALLGHCSWFSGW